MTVEAVSRDALAVGRALFGSALREVRTLPGGVMSFREVAETEKGERFVLRFYPASRSQVVEFEPDVLRRCRGAGLPVPEVIADSRSGPPATLAYMVYRWIPGCTLQERLATMTSSRREAAARRIVEFLVGLSELSMVGYGEPRSAEHARDEGWGAFVRGSFDRGVRAAREHGLLSADLLDRLDDVRGEHLDGLDAPAGLVWSDVSARNVVVDADDRVAGFLDLEGALSGDILLNLGYGHARYGDGGLFRLLRGAWPSALGTEGARRVRLYAVLRGLRIAPYAHERLPTGLTREPLESYFPGIRLAVDGLLGGGTGSSGGW